MAQVRRWQDYKNPGSVDQDPIFKNNKLPAHQASIIAHSTVLMSSAVC